MDLLQDGKGRLLEINLIFNKWEFYNMPYSITVSVLHTRGG